MSVWCDHGPERKISVQVSKLSLTEILSSKETHFIWVSSALFLQMCRTATLGLHHLAEHHHIIYLLDITQLDGCRCPRAQLCFRKSEKKI